MKQTGTTMVKIRKDFVGRIINVEIERFRLYFSTSAVHDAAFLSQNGCVSYSYILIT